MQQGTEPFGDRTMTAEVAVMNCLGVALAADSAVTIGKKGYFSADKLFHLRDDAPVGIAIYGNTNLLEIPLEAIVKMYRELQRSVKPKPSIEQYADDFIEYLEGEGAMFSPDAQERFVKSAANEFYRRLRDKFFGGLAKEGKPFTIEQVNQNFPTFLRTELKVAGGLKEFEGVTQGLKQRVRKKYATGIVSAWGQVFGKSEGFVLSRSTEQLLSKLFVESLVRTSEYLASVHSGLVITGFGDSEHFPSLVKLTLGGIVCDNLLRLGDAPVRIGDKGVGSACISPFAQTEMVCTFMEGIDPRLQVVIDKSTTRLFEKAIGLIFDRVKEKDPEYATHLQKAVDESLKGMLRDLKKKRDEAVRDIFVGPVLDMVAAMPKEELGTVAESLVNLTKFKRHTTGVQETVGGPIDVAIITKGDGFVWMKRKHYFKAELNPRYLARLNRGDAP